MGLQIELFFLPTTFVGFRELLHQDGQFLPAIFCFLSKKQPTDVQFL
jgi:hypothetical protein